MDDELLNDAARLAAQLGQVIVATADSQGETHVAVGERLTVVDGQTVTLRAWSCPQTLRNIEDNHRITLVVWNRGDDMGWQLAGEVLRVEDHELLDGLAPGETEVPPMPQIQRILHIRVHKVLRFSHLPHSDVEV